MRWDGCVEERRGKGDRPCLHELRLNVTYHAPLAEAVYDFYDKLKSISRGYASLDTRPGHDYRASDLVKLPTFER